MFTQATASTPQERQSAIIRNPLVVSPDATLMDAIAQMTGRPFCSVPLDDLFGDTAATIAEHQRPTQLLDDRSSCAVVVDAGQVVGILTERDIVRLSAQQQPFDQLTLRQVMTRPVLTLQESAFTDLWSAVHLIHQHHLQHLPIVDAQDQLVGLLTQASLLQALNPLAPPISSGKAVTYSPLQHNLTERALPENPPEALNSQNQKQIEIERQRYQDLFNFAPDGYLVTDTAGVIHDGNRRFFDQLATTPDLLVGTAFGACVAQSHHHLYDLHLETAVSHNKTQIWEMMLNPRSGDPFPVEVTVTPIYAPDQTATELLWLIHDISERKKTEAVLQNLIEGTAMTIGEDFFPAMVQYVAKTLNVSYALVSELVGEDLQVLAFSANGGLQPTFSFKFANTPCERAWRDGLFYAERSIQQRFPAHLDLKKMGVQSYLGVALRDSLGQPIGNLCVLDQQPLQDVERIKNLLNVFAARAGAELERKRATTALEQLNQELEGKVASRTAALQSSESRYRALMEGASDAIFLADSQGKLIEVNQRGVDLLGYSREELTQLHISNIHPPDALAAAIAYFQNIELCPTVSPLESELLRKDGSRVSIEMTGSFIELDGEKIVQGIFRDVSKRAKLEAERKQIEYKLLESQQFIQTVLDTFPLSIFWKDQNSTYLGCNRHFLKDAALESVQDLIGKTDYDMPWGNTEADLYRQDDQDVISSQTAKLRIIETQIQADGKQAWLETNKLPLFGLEGELVGVLGTYQDISHQKQAEFIIRQRAEQETLLREITQRIRQSLDLQTIFDTACQEIRQLMQADRVSVFQFYAEAQYDDGEFVAEAFLEGVSSVMGIQVYDHCFGEKYAPLYLQGRYAAMPDIFQLDQCHTDVLAKIDVRANLVVPLLCGDDLWGLLCVHQCSGPRHWQQDEIDLTQQLANQLAIAIQQANLFEQLQQELTERQQAQRQLTERNQQLAVSNEELARATRLKDEFLANMSHELRTPLNAILGMTEGLTEQIFGSINDRQIKALATIHHSGTHLLSLINDILDVAKIEAGHIELDLAPVAATKLCQSSLTLIKQQALQKKIHITANLPVDLPKLFVDERRIRQVLINLLSNAVKFTPEGGHITLEVTDPRPHFLRIAVTDTGIGIAPEHIHKLFQPFIQIDSALNRQYQGTGLGLALVKRIVELHGGQVHLTSELGAGSCFMVDLPCAETTCAAVLNPKSTDRISSSTVLNTLSAANAPLILLAEDNEANIATMTSYLETKGYHIVVAKNGRQAIALAEATPPDLILMDIQMPEMDGLEAMRQIRRSPSLGDVPIIALTALAMTGDQERCLTAGANDYLTKPIKLKHLVTRIQALLNDHQIESEINWES